MVRLGDIAEVHRDGRAFTYTREWAPNSDLVPAYGIPRRCWTQDAVYTGERCVLITTNTPIYNTIGSIHYQAWAVDGPCAYTPDIWRITLKGNVQLTGSLRFLFITENHIAQALNNAMGFFYNIGTPPDNSDDEEDPIQRLLDYDITTSSQNRQIYLPEHYYSEKYWHEDPISLTIPNAMPGVSKHYQFANGDLTKVTFTYSGANIIIYRGYIVAVFSEWDILITDGIHLTKWDNTVSGDASVGAILCEYGLGQPNGDIGQAFLDWAWREYMDTRDALVKQNMPGPIFEEVGENLETRWASE